MLNNFFIWASDDGNSHRFFIYHGTSYSRGVNLIRTKYNLDCYLYSGTSFGPTQIKNLLNWTRFKQHGRWLNIFGDWPGTICFYCYTWFPELKSVDRAGLVKSCYSCQIDITRFATNNYLTE